MRMEDPVRHAKYRFRSRVGAWQWRIALWGILRYSFLTRNAKRWRKFVP